MTEYQKYINALRKCAKEHENDRTSTGHIIVSDLCRDTANLLEELKQESRWIPVSERLPKTDNENTMNKYNVLLWVANKIHPEREPQIYLGKLRQVKGDDGSGNFWGIKTEPCEWTIWGWSYLNEPEVIAWMPLPEPYKAESEE